MNHNFSNIYTDYVKENGDIDKSLFTNICHEFNIMIMDYILEGKEFDMGNNLSTLSILRKERDPRSPRLTGEKVINIKKNS